MANPTTAESDEANGRHADGGQLRLDAGRRFPRHVHAVGLRAARDGPRRAQERRPHDGDEPLGLRDRHARVLGGRVRASDGGRRGARALGGDARCRTRLCDHLAGKTSGSSAPRASSSAGAVPRPGVAAIFLFQMVFMDTAATIPTGALAERWKFSSFVVFSVFVVDDHLPGLRQLGLGRRLALDARQELRPRATATSTSPGRSVVHITGGVMALVGAKYVGPRIGKFGPRRLGPPDPGTQHSDGRARHA